MYLELERFNSNGLLMGLTKYKVIRQLECKDLSGDTKSVLESGNHIYMGGSMYIIDTNNLEEGERIKDCVDDYIIDQRDKLLEQIK